jgi:hypothetical protein
MYSQRMAPRVLVTALFISLWAQISAQDSLSFFEPTVRVTPAERQRLDAGDTVVKVVRARGRDLAIFSAARIDVSGDRLVTWVRRVVDLKKGPYVPQIGRFSIQPQMSDVQGLTLDDADLDSLRTCRSGDCDIKLSEPEIARVRLAIAGAGSKWKPAMQETFRDIVVERARAYLAGGLRELPPYRDRRTPMFGDDEFRLLLEESPFLRHIPQLPGHLKDFPLGAAPGIESFLYWSKETLGGKPIVSVTHVNIIRPDDPALPEALVAAKQVFASHYMTGSLAVTAIVDGVAPHRYLVYLNRSRIDVLDGFLGGFVRRIVERRLRSEAADVVRGLRRRLESGEPPN